MHGSQLSVNVCVCGKEAETSIFPGCGLISVDSGEARCSRIKTLIVCDKKFIFCHVLHMLLRIPKDCLPALHIHTGRPMCPGTAWSRAVAQLSGSHLSLGSDHPPRLLPGFSFCFPSATDTYPSLNPPGHHRDQKAWDNRKE